MDYTSIKQEKTNLAADLLSRKVEHLLTDQKKKRKITHGVTFECKICNKHFQSFQALGGHSTSHNRQKNRFHGLTAKMKSRAHECSVCGLEFSSGQSLGGHMKRHRKTTADHPSSSDSHLGPLDLESTVPDVPRLLPLFL